jgi:hypothetical protein
MVNLFGRIIAVAFCALLFACGNTPQNNTPPPLASDFFSGLYRVVNRIDADSVLYYRISSEGVNYRVTKYSWVVQKDSLFNRGLAPEIFNPESAHRVVANGGKSSISYIPQDSLYWYVNSPADYKLKRICADEGLTETSAVKSALQKHNALPN